MNAYYKKTDGVGHCPLCRGVVFKDLKKVFIDKENGDVSFIMRCPHCQKEVFVMLDVHDGVIIKSPEHSE